MTAVRKTDGHKTFHDDLFVSSFPMVLIFVLPNSSVLV